MEKIVISVLGRDKPGIIAAVAGILFEWSCNIENVSQTILQTEFAGIFIAQTPAGTDLQAFERDLRSGLNPMGLDVSIKSMNPGTIDDRPDNTEPFIITTRGPDRKGLVAAVTGVLARHRANITNMKAVFEGGDDPDKNVMIYEADIPQGKGDTDLYDELRKTAAELNLDISIQHRRIFVAINRI